MYEKALIAIIFVYCISSGVFIAQYLAGDIMGLELTNYNGTSIKSTLIDTNNIAAFNNATKNIGEGDYTITDVATAFIAAGNVVKELLLLLTGTYIFSLLLALGIPFPIVALMFIPYGFLLGRAIIAYIRGL